MTSDSLYELIYDYTLPQSYPRFNRAKVTLYCAAHYLRVEPRAILDLIAEEKLRTASLETMTLYSSQIENVKSEHAMWAAIERQICFNNLCNQFLELFPFDDRLGSVKSYQS